MVESTIRAVDANVLVRMVTASRGKMVRAEPIAALFEQDKVKIAGSFPQLEDPRRAAPGREVFDIACLARKYRGNLECIQDDNFHSTSCERCEWY
jgi:hypothetical protein